MTAADLIKVLIELDQQVISPRPSEWGKAALLVRHLARIAVGEVFPAILGDFDSIDLSSITRQAPRELNQPILDHIIQTHNTGATTDDPSQR